MKAVILLILLSFCSLLLAQGIETPWVNVRHSSRDANGNLHLRWEEMTGDVAMQCYYNQDNSDWNIAEPTQFSEITKEALLPYSFGTKLRYRFRYAMDDGEEFGAFMNPAFWDANSFPPSLNRMGFIGSDPVGDSLFTYNANLDITDSYVAKSPQKLYFSMKNHSGNYPTYVSLTSYNMYVGMFSNLSNPDTEQAYAVIYSFNIPGVISSGLYKVSYDPETETPSFTRLGDAQTQVSEGTLHMSCNFSDLTDDPDFGAWNEESNTLWLVPVTMAVAISMPSFEPVIDFVDQGALSMIVFQDTYYEVAQNSLPTVVSDVFNQEGHSFSVIYTDADNDFPVAVEFTTSNGTSLQAVESLAGYSLGAAYSVYFPDETVEYISWSFSDNGIDFVTGSFYPSANNDNSLIPLPLSCTMPNPVKSVPVAISIKGMQGKKLKADIYNLRGQKVGTIFDGSTTENRLSLSWDGKLQGRNASSGIYFLKISDGYSSVSRKFVITK
ncbi:MAG: T9SS type A sorting domain-containing protein [Candidatus Cloacimonetes bacterium]|nr:T9SS type A sorting domain-containing protein [Candidatus Cloacimonadota bacterium]